MSKCSLKLLLFLPLAVTVALGCGGTTDPRSVHVEGKVMFKGKPLPKGTIQFLPSKGNSGPAGYADIVDGTYSTKNVTGKGTVGGTHTAVINGYDGVPKPEAEMPYGKQLFPEFRTEIDIPKDSASPATHNFTIGGDGGP